MSYPYYVYYTYITNTGTVQIKLTNITSFISVDSVIELVDIAMTNVNAVLSVMQTLTVDSTGGVRGGIGRGVERVEHVNSNDILDNNEEEDGVLGRQVSRDSSFRSSYMSASNINTGKEDRGDRSNVGGGSEGKKNICVSPQGKFNRSRARTTSTVSASLTSLASKKKYEKSVDQPVSFLMNVIVSVINARVLLLENPESANSRAIVVRCSLSVHYCYDSKLIVDIPLEIAVVETSHISVQTLEIFALTGLTHGRPQQIGEEFLLYF